MRPSPQPEAYEEVDDDEQVAELLRIMADAMRHRTSVPAEPPALFRNKKHQDIRLWRLTCTDYFGRNSWQWEDEAQRIRYAISRIEWKEFPPFALTKLCQMTGELGYTKQAGYEFWYVFGEQAL